MSFFVEAGGQGVSRGGKGILLSGLRKIGWAKQDGGGGGRIRGHKLGGHSMGSGVGRANLNNYSPKNDLKQRMSDYLTRGRRSGSGMGGNGGRNGRPPHLFGRSSFNGPTSITGDVGKRWTRHQRGGNNQNGYTPRPRSFIKF